MDKFLEKLGENSSKIVTAFLFFLVSCFVFMCTGILPPTGYWTSKPKDPDPQVAINAAQEKLEEKAKAMKALEVKIRKDLEDDQEAKEKAQKAQKVAFDKAVVAEADRREQVKTAKEKAVKDGLDEAVKKELEKKIQQFKEEEEAKKAEEKPSQTSIPRLQEELRELEKEARDV